MAYFPNSSAGEVLDEQCADCPLGAGWHDPSQGELCDREPHSRACPVALVQLAFNYEQHGNENLTRAMNMLINERGECLVRRELVDVRRSGGE